MPGADDLVTNLTMRLGGTLIMASDNSDEMYERPQGFRTQLETPSQAAFECVFGALAGGATEIAMPPGETFWAERFTMFTDRFGTPWMLIFMSDKIEIENINSPGRTERVGSSKYEAMRKALLAVLPDAPPGLKVPEAQAALPPLLPDALFSADDKAGWWLQAVQLDLEAKGIIKHAPSKPVQLFRAALAV